MTTDRFSEVRGLLHRLALVRDELHDPKAVEDWCNGLTVASCGLMHEEHTMQREVKAEAKAKRFPLGRPKTAAGVALLLALLIPATMQAAANPADAPRWEAD
jgi:hypothetical protein